MAPTRASEVRAQKIEPKSRNTLSSKRYRSTGYRPSIDYSQNRDQYKKIPDISEK